MNKSQSGFTLVELVVVILILGILGATALPRFMNVNTQAHEAAVAGAGGGFGAGIALLHAQWVANGSALGATDLDDVAGFGDGLADVSDGSVAGSTAGWPTDGGVANGTNTVSALGAATQCLAIWNNIMQNPPSVIAGAITADFTAVQNANQCVYSYNPDGTTFMSITYNVNNGGVIVDSDSSI